MQLNFAVFGRNHEVYCELLYL